MTFSSEIITIILLVGLFIVLMIGYPLGIAIGFLALIAGLPLFGLSPTLDMLYNRMWASLDNYSLVCVPLFIFMGATLARSGVAESLFEAIQMVAGRVRGSIAFSTIFIGTLLAACIGTAGPATSLINLLAMPSMMKAGYNKALSAGIIGAAGTLGILIPPSIMLIVIAPAAGLSSGKLFFAAIIPGFLLAGLYFTYITIIALVKPDYMPVAPPTGTQVPLFKKIRLLLFSLVPPLILIFAVMGTIFLGIAPTTEASAVGAFAAVILAICYRKFNIKILKQVSIESITITGKVMLMLAFAAAFTSIFVRAGGADVVKELILNTPGGKWTIFIVIQLIVLILGGPLDWMPICLILIPIIMPIGVALQFDPIWWVMMVCVNLQTSFLSPPYATAIFIIQATTPKHFGVATSDIMKGMIPFCLLVVVGMVIMCVFPQIVLWLPNMMIR